MCVSVRADTRLALPATIGSWSTSIFGTHDLKRPQTTSLEWLKSCSGSRSFERHLMNRYLVGCFNHGLHLIPETSQFDWLVSFDSGLFQSIWLSDSFGGIGWAINQGSLSLSLFKANDSCRSRSERLWTKAPTYLEGKASWAILSWLVEHTLEKWDLERHKSSRCATCLQLSPWIPRHLMSQFRWSSRIATFNNLSWVLRVVERLLLAKYGW